MTGESPGVLFLLRQPASGVSFGLELKGTGSLLLGNEITIEPAGYFEDDEPFETCSCCLLEAAERGKLSGNEN